jgi:hypothetical protein
MTTQRETQAYQCGAGDGVDAANADAPTPETNVGVVINRAWDASVQQTDLDTPSERDEYFVGWTHGYVNRAEGIEDEAATERRPAPETQATQAITGQRQTATEPSGQHVL